MSKKIKQRHICHLTSGHPPSDDRIFHKESVTLAKAGYEVVLIAQHSKEEIVNGVKIVPLHKPRNRYERMTKIDWQLFRLALKEKADVYHFHDPELIIVGILLKLLGKKVIYDVHELVYFSIEDKVWLGPRILRKLTQLVYLLVEKISVKMFDQLILAEDDYENYYKRTHKNFCKYTIVRNYPILSLIKSASPYTDIDKQKSVIIYAGGLGRLRGIKEIIQAMAFVKEEGELWLLGKWESEAFRKECEDSEGFKYTKYLGLVPLGEVYKYTKTADIGISILYPIKNYLTSLPIKAYEYMSCALPMVMSNFPCWRQTFGECALFADPYNPKDIAEKILCLLDNPDKARQLGDRGKRLTAEKYNWETEGKKLVDIYEKVLE
jgi:glycosyltransferase involved in cell wall biosynthesis